LGVTRRKDRDGERERSPNSEQEFAVAPNTCHQVSRASMSFEGVSTTVREIQGIGCRDSWEA
jgi:hypothetical protein